MEEGAYKKRMKLPCKEIKCILFPSCINKKAIDCDILFQHATTLESNGGKTSGWAILNSNFPNLSTINREAGNYYKEMS